MDGVIRINKLIFTRKTRNWCQLPYPAHPRGCPNAYNGKCPYDNSLWITDLIDLNRPMWFVYSEFDVTAHAARMRAAHPTWTDRQCRNLLYWQPTSRKQMKERAIALMKTLNNTATARIITLPEYRGVNVYATAAHAGLKLDKINNVDICRHIALVGYRRRMRE
jgi:hypothetical protein